MFAADQLLGFLAAVVVLVILPGPNTALILAHSLSGGRRAGLATVAGVELGNVAHTLAAALGLSAILATSAYAFDAVKLVGAAILVLLGIREMREMVRTEASSSGPATLLDPRRALLRALVGSVFNPKAAIFFLAFLPQWVDPARGPVLPQFLVLGAIVCLVGATFGTAMAIVAAALVSRLRQHSTFWRWQRRLTGALLVGIGLRLATARANAS